MEIDTSLCQDRRRRSRNSPAKFKEYDLRKIRKDSILASNECFFRGLYSTAMWLGELAETLSLNDGTDEEYDVTITMERHSDFDLYFCAVACFDNKEYDRCAFLLRHCQSSICMFLSYYARFMSLEYKRLMNITDESMFHVKTDLGHYLDDLRDLFRELREDHMKGKLDGYCLFVYAVVCKKLHLKDEARDILLECVNKSETVYLWCAYMELCSVIESEDWIYKVEMQRSWMLYFFKSRFFVDFQMYEEAEKLLDCILREGFDKFHFANVQMAIAHQNQKRKKFDQHHDTHLDKAKMYFKRARKLDPNKLEGLDSYSNLLYVLEKKPSLRILSIECNEIDKNRAESFCVAGNFYSLHGEHTTAISVFMQGAKMYPYHSFLWCLLGHEFMGVKNPNAASASYKKAVNANHREYKAWYGLGQTHESFKLLKSSLVYYKKAYKMHRSDARILMAMGDLYEKLGKYVDAYKCYYIVRKADPYNVQIQKTIKRFLFERSKNPETALLFNEMLCNADDESCDFKFSTACIFLANKYFEDGNEKMGLLYKEKLRKGPHFKGDLEKIKHGGKAVSQASAASRKQEASSSANDMEIDDSL